jgi:hypothetical protein
MKRCEIRRRRITRHIQVPVAVKEVVVKVVLMSADVAVRGTDTVVSSPGPPKNFEHIPSAY